jgi:hypothetical protein
MAKMMLTPDTDSYTVTRNSGVVPLPVEGAPRCRRDQLDTSSIVTVTWTIDSPSDYQYIVAFYKYTRGSEFGIDLIVNGTIETVLARIVPESFELKSITGLTYVFGATLEILVWP